MSRTLKNFHKVMAARCRGRTLLVGRRDPALEQAVLRQASEVLWVPDENHLPDRTFFTVLAVNFLEHVEEARDETVLSGLWSRVAAGGRMVVSVPNEDLHRDTEAVREFDRKTLRRKLAGLGKVKLATEQPLRWLTMVVSKPREGAPVPSREKRARFRATARQCRGRVLELGCGEGHLARAIAERGHEVVGVDMSAVKIERAMSFHPGIRFVEEDILRYRSDRRFDTVVIAEVLEHVDTETGEAMLDTAWEHLAPGGRLVVSVPNEDCVPHPNHVREFDRRGLKRMLRRLGRPRPVAEQPYKWLMMTVEKGS